MLLQGFFREFSQRLRQLSGSAAVDGLCRLGHQVLLIHESFFLLLFVDVPLSSRYSVGGSDRFLCKRRLCVRRLINTAKTKFSRRPVSLESGRCGHREPEYFLTLDLKSGKSGKGR